MFKVNWPNPHVVFILETKHGRSIAEILWATCVLSLPSLHCDYFSSAAVRKMTDLMIEPLFGIQSSAAVKTDVDAAVRVQWSPIISKWALLDIWQHLYTPTTNYPVMNAQRLNTEKSYSFIFKDGCSVNFKGFFFFLLFPVQLFRLNLNAAVSFKQGILVLKHKQFKIRPYHLRQHRPRWRKIFVSGQMCSWWKRCV